MSDCSNGANTILAVSSIHSVAELRGKRIPSDQLSLEKEFESGTIEVIVMYPPVGVQRDALRRFNRIFSSADISAEVFDVLMFDKLTLATGRDDVRKIIAALQRAQQQVLANPRESSDIMARREGSAPSNFRRH